MNDNTVGPGHNQPPDAAALLIERAHALVVAADKWTEITNAEQSRRIGDYIEQLREAGRDLEKAEDFEKRPLMKALDAVRDKFRRSRNGIQAALVHARGLADGWLRKETMRLALEKAAAELAADRARREAERQLTEAQVSGLLSAELDARAATEEADKLAETAEKAPTRPTIRADLSGKAISQTTRWSAEIVDAKKAHAFYLKNPEAVAAFEAAILKLARLVAIATKDETKAPPGIRFVKTTSA